MCSECQPSLIRCPICDIKYRSCLTRDFFAEKLLEHLDRRCRYQHFGCDASYKDSRELVEHETACEHKPAQPAAKRKKTREEAVNDAGPDDQEEEESDEDEDDDEEEEIEIEDVFLSNFAFILVLLRAYVLEFVEYDEDRVIPDSLNFEYLLVFLLCAWLYHSWQENGFHLMLDETSPFMAAWFMSLVLMMMMLKAYFVPWTSPDRMTAYLVLVAQLKPALTLLTGVFSCSVHCFVHQLWREENVFVLSCVLAISLALSSIEIFWSLQVRSHLLNKVLPRRSEIDFQYLQYSSFSFLSNPSPFVQVQMDQLFYNLFWLQSFFIVLPFGLAGRNFLEF